MFKNEIYIQMRKIKFFLFQPNSYFNEIKIIFVILYLLVTSHKSCGINI